MGVDNGVLREVSYSFTAGVPRGKSGGNDGCWGTVDRARGACAAVRGRNGDGDGRGNRLRTSAYRRRCRSSRRSGSSRSRQGQRRAPERAMLIRATPPSPTAAHPSIKVALPATPTSIARRRARAQVSVRLAVADAASLGAAFGIAVAAVDRTGIEATTGVVGGIVTVLAWLAVAAVLGRYDVPAHRAGRRAVGPAGVVAMLATVTWIAAAIGSSRRISAGRRRRSSSSSPSLPSCSSRPRTN